MGLAAARNSGFAASRGEYLAFLDADDRLMPDGLDAGMKCLAQHSECAFTWGRYTMRNERGETWEPPDKSHEDDDMYASLLRGNQIVMHATVLYRRSPLELVGAFDARLTACEDYELYLRMARRFPIVKHQNLVAEYRKHGSNMSVDSPRMLQAALRVLAAQQDYVDENPVYKNAYASGVRFWKRFYGVRSIGKIARELFALRMADAISDAGCLFRSAGTSTVLLNAPFWLIHHWVSERSRKRGR
jgi:glycosyltransferase involved in cell wall biosynthesis